MAQKQPILYNRTTGLRGTPQTSDDVVTWCATHQTSCSGTFTIQANDVIVTVADELTIECPDIVETAGLWSRRRSMVTTATLGTVATNTVVVRTAPLTRIEARVYGVSVTGANVFNVDCTVTGSIYGTGTIIEAMPVTNVSIVDPGANVTVLVQPAQTAIRVQGSPGIDITWYLDITTTSMGT